MRTLYNITLEIQNLDETKYDMLLDFLEDNLVDYEQTDYEEYEVDNRSESEKYDDWLSSRADEIHDEQMIEII